MSYKYNDFQYQLLINCSEKEDFTEWNDFVSKTEEIIDLRESNLENIKIVDALFRNSNGKGANFSEANLKGLRLKGVDMSECCFHKSEMTGINACGSIFCESDLYEANISHASFSMCNFDKSQFHRSNLNLAKFFNSSFFDCAFYGADISDAQFLGGGKNPFVKGELRFNLCGAIFKNAKFTSKTYFDLANVSRETDFRSISFESACYSAGLRQSLQYCNRRHNWHAWYEKNGKIKSLLVKLFWLASDYGRSPKQLIISFLMVCLCYSILYWLIPGATSGNDGMDLNLAQSLYFSVVTMTTLGFGDIYANKLSYLSQVLVVTHVLCGYVILGALLAVLSNLFNSDGPPEGLIKHPNKSRSIRFNIK